MPDNKWPHATEWKNLSIGLYSLAILVWLGAVLMGKVVESFGEITLGITKILWEGLFGIREGGELAMLWLLTVAVTLYSLTRTASFLYEYWMDRRVVYNILKCRDFALEGYVKAVHRETRHMNLRLAFAEVRERAENVLVILKEIEAAQQSKHS
ncbi:MAG: hypothetical protein GDA65_19450 [Nitrospira sp. CR1.1]|nr:hypothetical protein [Nitrospira sp. CR1.1]